MEYIVTLFKKSRPFRFVVAGGVSAAVELSSFLALAKLVGGVYWPALVSFALGLIASYVLNSRIVFRFKPGKENRPRTQIAAFVFLGIFNAVISPWLVVLVSNVLPALISKLIIMASVAIWNYLIMKIFIFRATTSSN